MKVFINDEERTFSNNNLMLIDVLNEIKVKPTALIAELDGKIIMGDEFKNAKVKEGSRIELIRIVGG
ncbi:MAG: sulfur carrier protein ThiS, partial [Pseudomonadota bacterium]